MFYRTKDRFISYLIIFKNIAKNLSRNKNICVIGVDGSGKSSIVNNLKGFLSEECEIQYMGTRDHLSKIAKKRFSYGREQRKNKNIVSKIVNSVVNITILLIEMWYRVIRHWTESKIVIYDRYTWDIYLSSYGIKKTIMKLLFKVFFPKPEFVFYLYCPLEVSLKRKDDIVDIDLFKRTKQSYDKEYINSSKVISLDSSVFNIEEITDIILKEMKIKKSI